MGENLEKLKNHLRRISKFENALSLLHWDLETYMPRNASEKRAEIIGEIAGYTFKEFTSDKTFELLLKAENEAQTTEDKALIRVTKKEFEKSKKIPPELFIEFQIESSKAQNAWQLAKKEDDFNFFKPHLEKIVNLSKEIAEHLGYEENRYDALLDNYEPGLNTKDLLNMLPSLRNFLINLLEKIENSTKPKKDILIGKFDVKKQKILSEFILKKLNFDFNSGRLDLSEHPFTITISHNDVRITTKFDEKDIRKGIFGTIHECGHALYEMGIPENLRGLPIGDGASMGIHESQSRFWENIIGRSYNFWKYFYPKLTEIFPHFSNISLEEFWRSINTVEKSLVRVEADEVTYNLHIMLRFEIEEGLINDKIKISDLPEMWNQKMKEYLGITPKSYKEGVLQDIHWALGSFGYFPSYMLGNLYAAQIYYSLLKDLEKIDEKIENGEFIEILNWLREKIHSKGKIYEPQELISQISGEKLNPNYFIDYLNLKYKKIYNL